MSYPFYKWICLVCNAVLYIGFVGLCFGSKSNEMFWQYAQGALGCYYIIGLLAVLYYSISLIVFFKTNHPEDEFFFDMNFTSKSPYRGLTPRQVVIRRVSSEIIYTYTQVYVYTILKIHATYHVFIGDYD